MCCRQIPGFPVYGMGQPQEAGFTQLAEKLPKGLVSSSKLNPFFAKSVKTVKILTLNVLSRWNKYVLFLLLHNNNENYA
jgi:hypothetical protein